MHSTGRFDATADTDEDVRVLHNMGYAQELARRLGRFSNFAISFSIICILAGGINSLAQVTAGAGGAAIGFGWPLGVFISGVFGLAMAQIASAYPTAGGLYHWGSILGNRFTGWLTAWFNLLGLVTVLGSINVGAYNFFLGAFGPSLGMVDTTTARILFLAVVTGAQALINHYGIGLTAKLTDFSGFLIFGGSLLLALVCLVYAPSHDWSRLWTFRNYSGTPAGAAPVWPHVSGTWVFLLGLLLPVYTITGYDASAHTSEETRNAALAAPRGIVSSILWSGVFGYLFLCAFVLMIPDMDAAARQGWNVFFWAMDQQVPGTLKLCTYAVIFLAQVLCGLATVTSLLLAGRRPALLPGARPSVAAAPHAQRFDLGGLRPVGAVRVGLLGDLDRRHARVFHRRVVHRDLPVLLLHHSDHLRPVCLRRAEVAEDGAVEYRPRRLFAVCAPLDRRHGAAVCHRRAATQ